VTARQGSRFASAKFRGVKRRGSLRVAVGGLVAFTVAAGPAIHAAPTTSAASCRWMNPKQSPDTRAHELVSAMTLDEKIAELYGRGTATAGGAAGIVPAVPSLCIPALVFNDAGAGVGDAQILTTAFPDTVAQAASWDPKTQRAVGAAIGSEAWKKGVDVQLAPALDIARNPLGGRNFEYAGEDPYLAASTGAALVTGIQSQHVVATVKHFAVNDQETNRTSDSSDVDERTLEEIHLPAFEAAVRAGVGSVMCGYNRVNGRYACENRHLLTDILDKQFGFGGWVMSDWGATHSTAQAAMAGLDQEQNYSDDGLFSAKLKTAVLKHLVPMSRINDMVFRLMRTLFRVGVFDAPPPAQQQSKVTSTDVPAERQVALQSAEAGAVLLKNDRRTLPLRGQRLRIAVIGGPAGIQGVQHAYQGGGSARVPQSGTNLAVVTPLQAMVSRAAVAGDVVTYADGSNAAAAAAVAKAADVSVVFAADAESEGHDRPNLRLNDGSCDITGCSYPTGSTPDAVIAAVAAANPKTVVVLQTGGPVTMPWLSHVRSVLELWYPGEMDGTAAAALLFGDANPSGKLPVTFPRALADSPIRTAGQFPGVNDKRGVPHSVYSERLLVGYRWYDAKGIAPLFPFGFGLSYTTFGFGRLTARPVGNGVGVRFTVTNSGALTGAEVAQVYVSAPHVAGEPPRALAGFAKVTIAPHRSVTVTLTLAPRAFEQWDSRHHRWTSARGCYVIHVGDSSRSLPLSTSFCR
jgi:beta-glucosidase